MSGSLDLALVALVVAAAAAFVARRAFTAIRGKAPSCCSDSGGAPAGTSQSGASACSSCEGCAGCPGSGAKPR